MSIEKYIKDWEKLCDNDSELNSVRRQVATILKDSLTSMLDGIEKELPEAIQIKHEDWLMSGLGEYRKGDAKSSHNNYRQEVINIINSHR